jgi:hypothetical protein
MPNLVVKKEIKERKNEYDEELSPTYLDRFP